MKQINLLQQWTKQYSISTISTTYISIRLNYVIFNKESRLCMRLTEFFNFCTAAQNNQKLCLLFLFVFLSKYCQKNDPKLCLLFLFVFLSKSCQKNNQKLCSLFLFVYLSKSVQTDIFNRNILHIHRDT